MLVASRVLTLLLLSICNGLARHVQGVVTAVVGLCVFVLVGNMATMLCFPALVFQSVLLCVAAILWRATRRGPSFFLPLSCGATLIAYGLSGLLVLQTEWVYARLRARYPYESMEGRLPVPRGAATDATPPPATARRLARLEEDLPRHVGGMRGHLLKELHEDAVGLFINNPGFGATRMLYPSESRLAREPRKMPVPLQPGPATASAKSPGAFRRLDADQGALSQVLDDSILDFVNPRGFGYFKDRRHVAGFETHRFSEAPKPENRWKVRSLELVSLLLHSPAGVYVSAELPAMDRLHAMPTRPLDPFENLNLEALRLGEDIVAARDGEEIRMLGAVRSIGQCVGCHGGNRGALLGAFSYTLVPGGPK